MENVQIVGTGMAVPDNIVTNDDLTKLVDTSDEWITTRTGIKERRISKGQSTTDLAFEAALQALSEAKLGPEELEMIIVATTTPDNFTPCVACMLQDRLAAEKAVAFDIAAACSGFIYGLKVGSQFLKTGEYKNVLVIGAEVLSKIINWEDRNTCVLFGDGAGATVLRIGNEPGILSVYTASDGAKGKFLKCKSLPLNNPYYHEDTEEMSFVAMDGKEVFRFAGPAIVDAVKKLLEESKLSLQDIKYIVPHQANIRIIKYAAGKLNLDESKFFINLDKYGNTSAASVPIALHEMKEQGLLEKGDKIMMVGFGGGLTWGGAVVSWTMDN
jgi:3-oxoacyl-[acyl-carrier-protein] synthase III